MKLSQTVNEIFLAQSEIFHFTRGENAESDRENFAIRASHRA